MGKLYNYLKFYLCKIISYLPRNNNIAVYGAWFGDKFADNSKYMYLYANKNNSFKKNIWITSNNDIYLELIENKYQCYMKYSLRGIFYQLRAATVFICTGLDDVFAMTISGALIINLWHGVPLKKICYDDELNFCKLDPNIIRINSLISRNEYSICTSSKYLEIYQSAFKKNKKYILNLGQPRNDVFFNNSLEYFDAFIDELKEEKKKIILYMPTHRNEGKKNFPLEENFNFSRLNKICVDNNYIFLIKLHYYHKNDLYDLKNFTNIKNITNTNVDTQLLLKYSDILITDYSSCYIDYLLLNRPIIFYAFDLDDYINYDRDMYFNYDELIPTEKVKTYNDLEKALEYCILDNEVKYDKLGILDLFYDQSNRFITSPKIIDFIQKRRF